MGRTINLGSGVETSVSELAKIIFSEVGLSHIKPSYQPPRPGDVQRHLADVRLRSNCSDSTRESTSAKEFVGFWTTYDPVA